VPSQRAPSLLCCSSTSVRLRRRNGDAECFRLPLALHNLRARARYDAPSFSSMSETLHRWSQSRRLCRHTCQLLAQTAASGMSALYVALYSTGPHSAGLLTGASSPSEGRLCLFSTSSFSRAQLCQYVGDGFDALPRFTLRYTRFEHHGGPTSARLPTGAPDDASEFTSPAVSRRLTSAVKRLLLWRICASSSRFLHQIQQPFALCGGLHTARRQSGRPRVQRAATRSLRVRGLRSGGHGLILSSYRGTSLSIECTRKEHSIPFRAA